MSYSENLKVISLPANADLSSHQYKFVTINSSGKVALAGNGARVDGVLQNKPAAADRPAEVAISGVSKVYVGTSGVTAGNAISSDASGTANDATTGDNAAGVALATGTSGLIVNAKLALQIKPVA